MSTHANRLQVGSSRIDITPGKDVILGGTTISGKIYVDYIKDPLYVKTVVIAEGNRKLCIIALDLLMIIRRYVEEIRDELERRWGLDRDAVLLHATQNHKAPSLGHFKISEEYTEIPEEFDWLRGGDEGYHSFAVSRIIASVEHAIEAMEPVKIGVSSGVEGRLAFNRRMIMKDGSIGMPGAAGPADLLSRCLEGPMDPELGVVSFQSQSGQPAALLLSYTCHPVHQLGEFFISADWPGAWSDGLQKNYGDSCVPLVLNGACGNINPWDPYADAPNNDARIMGERLAQKTLQVMNRMRYQDQVVLDWRVHVIDIPLRQLNDVEVEAAKRYIAEHPTPRAIDEIFVDDRWVYASGLLDLHEQYKRNPLYHYEIQVLRIGDAAFVGLPGEPFAEGGMQIKLDSPAEFTYIVHNTQFAGYIPTSQAFERGGYEVNTANWSKFAPEAWEMIASEAGRILQSLFVKNPIERASIDANF